MGKIQHNPLPPPGKDMDDSQLLNLIHQTAVAHGCTIVDIDFNSKVLTLEGPESAKIDCAMAVSRLLEETDEIQ